MLETVFAMSKTIFLVVVVVPMMMGFVLSLLGFGAIEWTRLVERRRDRKLDRLEIRQIPEANQLTPKSLSAMAGVDT